jgi:hypothetical protein
MTNKIQPSALIYFLQPLLTNTVKLCLVDGDLHAQSDTDDYLDDLAGAVVSTSGALTNKSVTLDVDGVAWFKADNTSFTSVAAGDAYEYVYLIIDTGVASTSPIIGVVDVNVTPNGEDIPVLFNANGILGIGNVGV